jgi:hypothetical protein
MLAQGQVTAKLWLVNKHQPHPYATPTPEYLESVRSLASAISEYGAAATAILVMFS